MTDKTHDVAGKTSAQNQAAEADQKAKAKVAKADKAARVDNYDKANAEAKAAEAVARAAEANVEEAKKKAEALRKKATIAQKRAGQTAESETIKRPTFDQCNKDYFALEKKRRKANNDQTKKVQKAVEQALAGKQPKQTV